MGDAKSGQVSDRFAVLYNKTFQALVTMNDKMKKKYKNESPQHQRLIAFVDERKNDPAIKKVIMYEPPSDCSDLPNSVPSEWYLAASAMCLIPKKNYKPKYMMADDEKNEQEKDQENAIGAKLMNSTIGSKSSGAMLTVSFHVKEMDQILCYLYINGQYLRLMPEDIINILPRFFVETQQSKIWLNEGAQHMVDEMKKILVDEQFEQFVRVHCNNMKE